MPDTPRDRPPAPTCQPFCPAAAAALARLLAAHTPDRPLLTPTGAAYVRAFLQAASGADDVPVPFDGIGDVRGEPPPAEDSPLILPAGRHP